MSIPRTREKGSLNFIGIIGQRNKFHQIVEFVRLRGEPELRYKVSKHDKTIVEVLRVIYKHALREEASLSRSLEQR